MHGGVRRAAGRSRIEPGHDGWVVGDEPAVMIEFDLERDTVRRLGMPAEHSH
jgi:hypothetical protein